MRRLVTGQCLTRQGRQPLSRAEELARLSMLGQHWPAPDGRRVAVVERRPWFARRCAWRGSRLALSALTLHSNLRYGRYLTASSLPTGAVFAFVVVLIANAPFARRRSRLALARGELATIFSMLFLSAALPQASVGETLVTLAVAPAYLPKGAPHVDKFDNKVPNWLLVQDARAIEKFYTGLGTAGGPVPWGAWFVPLLGWSAFVLLLLAALYCLSRFFTHRWVREERVSFPLMELPLELLNVRNDPRPVWRQWLFWLGALVPATLITLGQLHSYYPQFPEGRQILDFKVGKAFIEPPLSALSEFTLSFWPMVIGISYLLNAEVAASIWFFHLLFWAQLVFWAALGYRWQEANTGGKGFQPLDWIHNTEFGAALVLAGLLLLTVRKDVARALQALFVGGQRRSSDRCRCRPGPRAASSSPTRECSPGAWPPGERRLCRPVARVPVRHRDCAGPHGRGGRPVSGGQRLHAPAAPVRSGRRRRH
jgi:hypothetical protein